MVKRRLICRAAAIAAIICTPVAGLAAGYTSFWSLGDSLSDPGNLWVATGMTIPVDPPYFEGRRSNGPVWAEHLAGDFEARGLPNDNFSYVFANAVTNVDPLPIQIPDLEAQLNIFAATSAGQLGNRPLATIWFGANDIFQGIRAEPTQENVGAVAAGAANAVADGVAAISGLGVADVLVANLPPLDLTPQFTTITPEAAPLAQYGTAVFNATLAARLAASSGVTILDVNGLMNDAIRNPADYGLTNVTDYCALPEPHNVLLCTEEELETYLFFDLVHPTAKGHEEIAGIARAAGVAPVPVPLPAWLLVSGLAGLIVAGRRRA